MTNNNPCTVLVRAARSVRGGKNFEARYQAERAAREQHAAQYCGAVVSTLHWGAAGSVRGVTSEPHAEIFAASCLMPEAFHVPQRYVPKDVLVAAVNPCS